MADGDVQKESTFEVDRIEYVDEGQDRWAIYERILSAAILLVVATALSAVLYYVAAGVINPPAPRTAFEARKAVIEDSLLTNAGNGKIWADYILLNTTLGQNDAADQAYSEAKVKLAKLPAQRQKADLAWAQSLLMQGRYAEAVKQADQVLAEDADVVKSLAKDNAVAAKEGMVISGALSPAYAVKGHAYSKLQKWQQAVDAYSDALEIHGSSADMLVARGAAYVEMGDKASARRDFKKALTYIPDNAEALRYMEQIGDAQ